MQNKEITIENKVLAVMQEHKTTLTRAETLRILKRIAMDFQFEIDTKIGFMKLDNWWNQKAS